MKFSAHTKTWRAGFASACFAAAIMTVPGVALAQPTGDDEQPAGETPTPGGDTGETPSGEVPKDGASASASLAANAKARCEARLIQNAESAQLPQSSAAPGEAPFSPLEKDVVAEVEKAYTNYETAWTSHNDRMQTILIREYSERKNKLDERYASKIKSAEKEERRRHLEAMAKLEAFVKTYPDNQEFTPDAMFRLADLYLDEAEYQFDAQMSAPAPAPAPTDGTEVAGEEEPAEPVANYNRAVEMWRELLAKFPEYRQKAGTLYLLAYYLKQTGEDRRALQVARGLVCNNKFNPMDEPPPPPEKELVRRTLAAGQKFVTPDPYVGCTPLTKNKQLQQEAWVRIIGDIHFYTAGELSEAIAAYERVTADPKSKYYDEALYKVAWSYYRNDDFLKGIKAFDDSVILSDKLVAAGKEPLELRPEAVQYIAISFTDPWTVEEQTNAETAWNRVMAFYGNRLKEPHIRDIFVTLGETFRILEAYPQAIDAWRIALKHSPMHPKNPMVHQNIVTAFEAMGDKDRADDEAAKLATEYAVCSDWFLANETNREAMDDQQRIGQRMLRAAAENTHRTAQEARKDYNVNPTPEGKTNYVSLYKKAAALYKQFLITYPTAKDSYELTYRLGETSFFSEQYMESVKYYKWVRDHRELSSERFEKAAKSVVQAYEKEIEVRIAAGELTEPDVPKVEELRAMPKPIKAMDIPPLFKDLRQAYDEYQQLVKEPSTAPNMGLNAALVSYRFLNLTDAATRFQVVLDKHCGSPEAVNAKDGLLAIYEARNESAKFKATNDKFIASKCGTDSDIQLAKAQNRSRDFRDAEELFKNKQYAEASSAFYKYYKTAAKTDASLPIALYNSAIAFDRSDRPKTAIFLFKEFTDNPAKEFRQSEYYVEALYLTALSHQKAFEYEEAVSKYLQTAGVAAEKGRKAPPGGRTLAQIRLDSLYNAALLREIDRVYTDPRAQPGTGAASLYKKYAREESDVTKRDDALWAVARVWKSAKKITDMRDAYTAWRKVTDPAKNPDRYVFSYYDLAKEYQKRGSTTAAKTAKADTIKAWARAGSPTGGEAATMAAEFEFAIAEAYYMGTFDKFKISSLATEKKAKTALDSLDKLTAATKDKFNKVSQYGAGFWSRAALVRIGDAEFFSALKIQQAPVPKEIEKLDEKYPDKEILLRYEETIENLVKPKTDAAKAQWERVAKVGKDKGVSDEWIKLAQERLHDFVSQDDFPVLRDELAEGTDKP